MKKIALSLLLFVSISCYSQTGLFLHTDKSLYTYGERIYFSGYVVSSKLPVDTFNTMYVVLSGNGRQVMCRYIMTDGFATGSIAVPDSFSTGQYNLIAYTDKYLTDTDHGFYKQTVSILSNGKPVKRSYEPMEVSKSVFAYLYGDTVRIEVDSSEYHMLSKVKLKIYTKTGALFSLSCAFSGRMDIASLPNITRFIVSRRVPCMISTSETTDYGVLRFNGKKLKKPKDILTFGSMSAIISTDKEGNFSLSHDDLLQKEGKDVRLGIVAKDPTGYEIKVANRYEDYNYMFLGLPVDSIMRPKIDTIESEIVKKAEGKTLGAVVIKSSKESAQWGKEVGGRCPDWVCMYGYLNCKNHPFGTKPLIGYTYKYRECTTCFNGQGYVYKGCTTEIVPAVKQVDIRPIYMPSLSNPFMKDADDVTIQTNTTIAWFPIIITDKNGYAEVEFYTSHINGLFYLVLQGLNQNGPISAVTTLKVKR
jgi:hypothetical protein